MFVLDTNVVSELRRPEKTDRKVAAWASSVPLASIFLSVITLLELELGALAMARKDALQGKTLRDWVDRQIAPRFEGRIIPVDAAVARRCAALHVPDPRPDRDALLAATALAHEMIIVTRNVADLEATGARIFNPRL